MKRIASTLFLLFVFCYINGQDIVIRQPLETNLNNYKTETTENLNEDRNIKFHILYSATLTTNRNLITPLGLTLAAGKKWGGYVSGGYSISDEAFNFLTVGALARVFPNVNIYAGGGITGWTNRLTQYGNCRCSNFGLETGAIVNIRFLSLMAGLGSSFLEIKTYGFEISVGDIFYAKLGLGINF